MTQGREVTVVKETGEIIESTIDTQLTSLSIDHMHQQIQLAEKLVSTVMEEGIDYGQVPGIAGGGKGLFDPGAAKVIRAFGLHIEHKVIFNESSDENTSWTIQASLVNNVGAIVGTGLGAASTREVKYRYLWKENPQDFGYSPEEIEKLKTRAGYNNIVLYRIENPDHGDLINTLLQMASKRAEVDAARSLPGVGAALRRKFEEKPQKATGKADDLPWTLPQFWGFIKNSGLNEDDVHRLLQVKSMKDWLASGKTLKQGAELVLKLAVIKAKGKSKTTPPQSDEPPEKTPSSAAAVKPEDVPNLDMAINLAKYYWNMGEETFFTELGYFDRENFESAKVQTPWEAFQAIRDSR